MLLRVRDVQFRESPARARIPFHFGSVSLQSAPLCTVRVEIEIAPGHKAEGFAADLLIPKWFEKDPATTLEEDQNRLRASCLAAATAFLDASDRPQPLFSLWWQVYQHRVGRILDPKSLLKGFGIALIERAVMDAACRAAELPFHQALLQDLFQIEASRIHPDLKGWKAATDLPKEPVNSVMIRHTVGLKDPIWTSDVSPADRIDDGLPQALQEDIQRWGVRMFKIKIGAGIEEDRERLLNIATLFKSCFEKTPRFSLDGNEQYPCLDDVICLLQQVEMLPGGSEFLRGLMFLEQPCPREHGLEGEDREPLQALAQYCPVVLDEGDFGIDAWPRAMEVGYRGVSVKNCKGVFRALLNRALCQRAGAPFFQTGEDLTNLAVLSLQQDLATMTSLGFSHIERNGHHYFPGLRHLPEQEAADALEHHGDLYERTPAGILLKLRNGFLVCGSVHQSGYGYSLPICWNQRQPFALQQPVD